MVKQESLRDERGIALSNFAVGTAANPVRRVPHRGKTTEASINPRISREQKNQRPGLTQGAARGELLCVEEP